MPAQPLDDRERQLAEIFSGAPDPREQQLATIFSQPRADPSEVPQPPPEETPGFLPALGRVATESAKEIVVGTPTAAAGFMSKAVESGVAFHPPLMAASLLHQGATGKPLSEAFFGAARAAYEDVVDAQADLINATERATGSEVPGAVLSTGVFGGVNAVNPGKFLRLGAAVLGIAPKALALGYAGFRGGRAGIRGLRNMARRAVQIGDVADAAVPVEGSLRAAERRLATLDVDLLARDARKAAEQQAMFPMVPQRMIQGGVPDIALAAAQKERQVVRAVPTAPTASMRLVEREILKSGDEVFAQVRKEVKDAAKEVSLRQADEITPSPPARPSLLFGDMREGGIQLAHQYTYNRAQATLNAARREIALKEALGGKAGAQLREDMTFLVQQTGNPKKGAGDTAQNVIDRIRAHPRGEEALRVVENLRERMDVAYRELNDLRVQVGETSLNYLDNYLHQSWKNIRGKMSRGRMKIPKDASIEKKRSLLNYRQGMLGLGLEPRTLDVAEIWHLTERELGRALATKRLFRDLVEVGVVDSPVPGLIRGRGVKAPEGYRLIKAPFLGDLVPGEGDLFIHDQLYRPLRNILEKAGSNRFEEAFDTVSAWAKRLNFSFTMFHAYSLSESAINALGPIGGPVLAGKLIARGGAVPIPGINTTKAMSNLLKTRTMQDAETIAMKHGVTVGAPPTDLMIQKWQSSLQMAREKLRIPKGADATRLYEWAQRQVDLALWDRYHHPMKVATHNILYDNLINLKRGHFKGAFRPIRHMQGRALSKMSDEQIGRSVAAFVNDQFGGQNWELAQGRVWEFMAQPKVLKWLRRIFISPDWNISSMRASLAFSGFLFGDPARGILGLRHWRNAMLGTYFYSNVLNYTLSGRMIWENEPGKDRWHIDTGAKDEKGKKIYIRIGKQYQELLEFAMPARGGVPFVNFLARKMFPYIQAATGAGELPSGFPTAVGRAKDQAVAEGRELDLIDYTKAFGETQLEAFAPFALSGTEFGPIIGLVPLPPSRGTSLFAAETRLAEAMRRDDREMVSRVIQALRENGYNGDDIQRVVSSAQTKAVRFR